jgi:hypothetical protein|tara:strand:- start:570 stop:860 length:291 start_codon:yes stop_codon:yes gene_type:complete
MSNNINYQSIYEEELSENLKLSLDQSSRFYDLTPEQQHLVEELIDAGYRRAVEEVLDPEVLADTASLAADMGTQLYGFANMLQAYLKHAGSVEETV